LRLFGFRRLRAAPSAATGTPSVALRVEGKRVLAENDVLSFSR
jgi:hypothetical protein